MSVSAHDVNVDRQLQYAANSTLIVQCTLLEFKMAKIQHTQRFAVCVFACTVTEKDRQHMLQSFEAHEFLYRQFDSWCLTAFADSALKT